MPKFPLYVRFIVRKFILPFDNSYFIFKVAIVYVFNLIVGAGALALPLAFAQTGWVLGIIALIVLAMMR